MSRYPQDADSPSRSRPRANTTSFPSFSWRKNRADQPSASPVSSSATSHQTLPLEALIEALTPPAVPSLAHARALAGVLSTYSPLPRWAILNPVLSSLCDVDSPITVQAAGYDILAAYWENHEAVLLATADRLSYFSLFLGSDIAWSVELWEPRFKALRALTRYGTDIIGIEARLINTLKLWIRGSFEGLLQADPTVERWEKLERERSIDVLVKFLSDIVDRPENIARITEEEILSILQFYGNLADKSIVLPNEGGQRGDASASPSDFPSNSSIHSKPSGLGHRRNHSSLSASSSPSLSTTSVPPPPPMPASKHPAEIAVTLYLNQLASQLKNLSPTLLSLIIPVLLRALAFSALPLPRLTILPHSHKKSSLEQRTAETLDALLSGPYATRCMLILKQHLFPPEFANEDEGDLGSAQIVVTTESDPITFARMTSLGAHRMLRHRIRHALSTRLARAYISRETSTGYSHAGVPAHMEVELDLMEKAWPKEDFSSSSGVSGVGNGWDAARIGKFLSESAEAWVVWNSNDSDGILHAEKDWNLDSSTQEKDKILEEVAGTLKDILQELDAREDDFTGVEEEEVQIVGEMLRKLAGYVLPLVNQDGTPYIVPIGQPTNAPTPLLRTLTSLLARDHPKALNSILSGVLIYIANHLTDADTARLPHLMMEQHDLSPTTPQWLDNWKSLLWNTTLTSPQRSLTRRAIMEVLALLYDSVRDMPAYRKPFSDMVLTFCVKSAGEHDDDQDDDAMWSILSDEVVLRTVEQLTSENSTDEVDSIVNLLFSVACQDTSEEEPGIGESSSVHTTETYSPSNSTVVSPTLSRMQSDSQSMTRDKEKDSGLPSVMSMLTSLTSAGTSTSRSQSVPHAVIEDPPDVLANPLHYGVPTSSRVISAVSALVTIFSRLVFTPYALEDRNLRLSIRIYELLLCILKDAKTRRARLTVLQFLMRLRVDRDHRLYFTASWYDGDGLVAMLASFINRGSGSMMNPASEHENEDPATEGSELRKARARVPQEKLSRHPSRGRGVGGLSRSRASRSRSRTAPSQPSKPPSRLREPIWRTPESLAFSISNMDSPSEGLVSYDPEGPDHRLVLPISQFLDVIIGILEREKDWEILSYVLCHLPTLLSNKHLFCGPKSRLVISKLLSVLCIGILSGELAFHVDIWSPGLKIRDAHGLAYHTLSVLISYRRCFDLQQRHLLVEVFQAGLNGQSSTIKCCLHALSLSAFELQSSMTKFLSKILEKLSQIMSNPNMAVHILGFLSIVGSLAPLYANFTEGDFKMVFGVALQYLQHYTRLKSSPTISWALSQHVRILSYTAVYVWFLAVKLPDRRHHIPYIARQLLLANEGNEQIDEPTEVCFDWLARYTYGSADPRPASSLFSEIVMNPSTESGSETLIKEKTWFLGNSVMTVRSLARVGWVEVLVRRPSGFSRFICRAENVPMIGPGDVAPDLTTIPAALIMDSGRSQVSSTDARPHSTRETEQAYVHDLLSTPQVQDSDTLIPDPITGYVWSGTAPSQRRKQVIIDPSYFVLQLSPYPEGVNASHIMVPQSTLLTKFINSLDRIPVIDTHKVGIMYVAPGQTNEAEILRNTHGSPAYTRFLEGIGRLINLRGQVDVYAGGLDPDEDGEYAYAWWDDIGQILYHTATMMPTNLDDPQSNYKKRHIGNDYVRIVWNDSGKPYRFDTLTTQFQFVNIVIEPHSLGAIAAFSNNIHENEYFKVTVQHAQGMTEFTPVGHFKVISAENLPLLVRQLSLLADWYASTFSQTQRDTARIAIKTNWHSRLEAIRRFRTQMEVPTEEAGEVLTQESLTRDFTSSF